MLSILLPTKLSNMLWVETRRVCIILLLLVCWLDLFVLVVLTFRSY